AIGLYQRAMEISREAGDVRGELAALSNIGYSYHAMDQPNNALPILNRALEMARSHGDRSAEMQVLHSMAVDNAKMDYPDLSDSLAQESLLIAEELEDEQGILSALMVLGENLIKQGRMAEAGPIYARAQVLDERAGGRQGLAVLYGLAAIHAARGEVKQAVALGQKALDRAKRMGEVSLIMESYGRLYETHKRAGQHAEALDM